MAKRTKVIFSGNGTQLIAKVRKKRDFSSWLASVFIDGVFGGGTVTLQASPDSGTTLTNIKDKNSQSISLNSAAVVPVEFGCGSHNDDIILLYATLSGATSPTVNITVFDAV